MLLIGLVTALTLAGGSLSSDILNRLRAHKTKCTCPRGPNIKITGTWADVGTNRFAARCRDCGANLDPDCQV